MIENQVSHIPEANRFINKKVYYKMKQFIFIAFFYFHKLFYTSG
jgi:hypothetical protein